MKNIAYLRVSKLDQALTNQRLFILDYAHKNRIKIHEFVEFNISSRRSPSDRGIDSLLKKLRPKDRLIVSELSRLGRSLGQIIQIVDKLIKKDVSFLAIKENIVINGRKQDMQTKVMVALFGLFAEIERDLISERTKEGLAAAKAKGKLLGRPKGTLGKSKLDGKEEEIRDLLRKEVSKASIAKIFEISRPALYSFIKTRRLEKI
jgi:DNA invertase Pin-like site-specific DNA recombinase